MARSAKPLTLGWLDLHRSYSQIRAQIAGHTRVRRQMPESPMGHGAGCRRRCRCRQSRQSHKAKAKAKAAVLLAPIPLCLCFADSSVASLSPTGSSFLLFRSPAPAHQPRCRRPQTPSIITSATADCGRQVRWWRARQCLIWLAQPLECRGAAARHDGFGTASALGFRCLRG